MVSINELNELIAPRQRDVDMCPTFHWIQGFSSFLRDQLASLHVSPVFRVWASSSSPSSLHSIARSFAWLVLLPTALLLVVYAWEELRRSLSPKNWPPQRKSMAMMLMIYFLLLYNILTNLFNALL